MRVYGELPVVRQAEGRPTDAAQRLALLVAMQLLGGHLDAARRELSRLQALATECPIPEIRARAHLAAGRVAAASGIVEFEAALAFVAHVDQPLLTAQIQLELARAWIVTDSNGALAACSAALAVFERLGADHDAQRARDLRQQLVRATGPDSVGVIARPATQHLVLLDGLTRRESDVARLVAEGMTNKGIAEKLYLSVRTVESHVNNAMVKRAYGTRTQLAAWVLEPRPQ